MGVARIEPAVANAPIFHCAATGAFPFPDAIPRIVWRLGLDLNPIDVSSDEQVEWLEALVWPGQEGRAEKLRAAIDVARADPPRIIKGDLLIDLGPLIAMAPKGAILVVFHTAVLPYVASQQQRDRFAAMMRRANAVWLSNEGRGYSRLLPQSCHPRQARSLDGRRRSSAWGLRVSRGDDRHAVDCGDYPDGQRSISDNEVDPAYRAFDKKREPDRIKSHRSGSAISPARSAHL
jgi:hypothetical protein